MAQTLLYPRVATTQRDQAKVKLPLAKLAALTPAVFLIHGYHPFSDDAGIYVAGISKLLDPALYRPDAPFVVANTRLSIFAHILAGAVRVSHLPLSAVLLVTHLASIYLFLLACWWLGSCIFREIAERWFAVAFAAACFTLPAAGTALVLMDPYVTSRSFSTPLGLLALAAIIDRRPKLAAVLVVLTGLMHPLMAIYAAALVVLYFLIDNRPIWAALSLCAAGAVTCGCMYLATRHSPVSPAYREAVSNHVRQFLFPWTWAWYEDFGLVAPLALMAIAAYRTERGGRTWKLCLACVLLGLSSILVAFLFAHRSGPYLLVRLQFLRSFLTIYAVGVVLLGGWLGRVLWYRVNARWLLFLMLAAASLGLYAAQRAAYPLSSHVEWPGRTEPLNPWEQAYVWIRKNTPENAVFAANTELVFLDGVDSQGFRATTERSILADAKDEGVAVIVDPSIVPEWAKQYNAQKNIDDESDQMRTARLKPFGVTWLLLPARASTRFPCPFNNGVAKVCRLE